MRRRPLPTTIIWTYWTTSIELQRPEEEPSRSDWAESQRGSRAAEKKAFERRRKKSANWRTVCNRSRWRYYVWLTRGQEEPSKNKDAIDITARESGAWKCSEQQEQELSTDTEAAVTSLLLRRYARPIWQEEQGFEQQKPSLQQERTKEQQQAAEERIWIRTKKWAATPHLHSTTTLI